MLVVEHSPLLDGFLGDGQVDLNHAVAIGLGTLHRQFKGIEQAAGVSACHINEVVGGIAADGDGAVAVAPLVVCKGALQQPLQILRFQRQ